MTAAEAADDDVGLCGLSLSLPRMAFTPNFRYGVVLVGPPAELVVGVVGLGSGETGEPRERTGKGPIPSGDRAVGGGRWRREEVRSLRRFSTMKEAEELGSAGWAGWGWGWGCDRAGWGASWDARNTPW